MNATYYRIWEQYRDRRLALGAAPAMASLARIRKDRDDALRAILENVYVCRDKTGAVVYAGATVAAARAFNRSVCGGSPIVGSRLPIGHARAPGDDVTSVRGFAGLVAIALRAA